MIRPTRCFRLSRTAGWATALTMLSGLSAGGCRPARSVLPAEARRPSVPAPATAVDMGAVGPRERRELVMRGVETHVYRLRLTAGELVRVVVVQRGVDVALHLYGPDGSLVTAVDSPSGTHGEERVAEVAARTGSYRLELVADDAAAPGGRYSLAVTAWRRATAADRVEVRAERAFDRGEELRRGHQPDEALGAYAAALAGWKSLETGATGPGEGSGPGSGVDLGAAEAEAVQRLGWAHFDARHWRAAARRYSEAVALFARRGDAAGQAPTLVRLARADIELLDLDAAVAALRQALALFRCLDDRQGMATAQQNLGDAWNYLGRTQPALDAYEAALGLWDERTDRRDRLHTLLNEGQLLNGVEQVEEAKSRYGEGLRLARELGDGEGEATGWFGLGNLEKRAGRPAAAADFEQRALTLFRRLHDRRRAAMVLLSLGSVHLGAGARRRAADEFGEALRLYRQEGDRLGEGWALLDLGRCAFAAGDYAQALAAHEAASRVLAARGDRQATAANAYGAALALQRLGRPAEALERVEAALSAVESLRGEVEVAELRRSYFASRQDYWDLDIELLMGLAAQRPWGDFAAQAFAANERRRSRSLLDLLGAMRQRPAAAPAVGGAGGRAAEIEERLRWIARRRFRLLADGAGEADLTALQRPEEDLMAQLLRLRGGAGEPATADSPPPLGLGAVQRLLDDDTLLLEYSLGTRGSFVWAVRRRAWHVYRLAPRAAIEAAARRVVEYSKLASQRAQSAGGRAAGELSALILTPLAGELTPHRILLVADGDLLYVPFAELPVAGAGKGSVEPLLAGHELPTEPSASVFAALRRRPPAAPALDAVAVMADPVFGDEDERLGAMVHAPRAGLDGAPAGSALARLPATRREAAAILGASPAGSRAVLGFDANRRMVLAGGLSRYGYLHFATHAMSVARQPDLSGLVLSLRDAQGRPEDGLLRLYEIYDLRLAARLVVLSGCDTGLGEAVAGEGLVGLSWGFLHAGARGVVVSLWQVPDESTAELMRRFYRALFVDRLPVAAALREAQMSMRADARWQAPYYWAGFALQGDWRDAEPGAPAAAVPGGASSRRPAFSVP